MKTIYTDGSCLKNPDGPGGWCAIIMDDIFEIQPIKIKWDT